MDNKNNSGYNNSGNYNSGYNNSGNYNSGNYNSGYNNSGYNNSGYNNSGNYNSGNYNSGYNNNGNYNSGNYNSGNYNSGNYNSGYFNTDEPTIRLFNKDTGKKRSELIIPCLYLLITEWLPENKMTDEQKKNDPQFRIKGGTLIKRSYHEAWAIAWAGTTQEVRNQFLALPNFDAAIFKEITGIDVTKAQSSCAGKIVEIEGKKYRLQEM